MVTIQLRNYTETVVNQVVNELIARSEGVCKCEKCRFDIMAMALNNLNPQYYVSQKGEVFSKLLANYVETRNRVIKEVTKASIAVNKNPHHEAR